MGVEAGLAVEMGIELRVGMRPAPSLIAYATLLALTVAEVEELVDGELEQNPALERVDPERCRRCGGIVITWGCPVCRSDKGAFAADGLRAMPLDTVEQAADPIAELRRDLGTILHSSDHALADHVLASLDGRGFLREGAHGVAKRLRTDVRRVEHVIDVIRALGPVGICAADARECLSIQLEARPALVAAHPILPSLVAEHLASLANGALGEIARRLGTSRAAVAAAREALTAELRPCALLDCSRVARSTRRVEPGAGVDIVVAVSEQDDRLLVELVEPLRLGVVISPSYDSITTRAAANGESAQLTRAQHDVERGRAFTHRLEKRWRTISRVAQGALEHQREFVLRSDAPLRPLTRSGLAGTLRMHESTVSRAAAGRTMLLPDGRVIALSALFDPSLGSRETLRRLVTGEGRNLSDRALADALAQRGHPVSRRTVTKYRARLGIVAAAQR